MPNFRLGEIRQCKPCGNFKGTESTQLSDLFCHAAGKSLSFRVVKKRAFAGRNALHFILIKFEFINMAKQFNFNEICSL